MSFGEWLSLAGLILNALIIPVLWKGASWVFQVEKRLTVVETQQMSAIDSLVHRRRQPEEKRE
jgi:hypothetical protein